jgi:hypothetical protein
MVVFICKSSQSKESWVDCLYYNSSMDGMSRPFLMSLTLALGQIQFQGRRQETHPLICPRTKLPFDEEMRGEPLWEACRGQRHDTFPLLSHSGVPWSCSGVRRGKFSRGRPASALPIQHLCLASVLGSISLHSQLQTSVSEPWWEVPVMGAGSMTHVFLSLVQEGWFLFALPCQLSCIPVSGVHLELCGEHIVRICEPMVWCVPHAIRGCRTSQIAHITWWWLSEFQDLSLAENSGQCPLLPWGQSMSLTDNAELWQDQGTHVYGSGKGRTGKFSQGCPPPRRFFSNTTGRR